MRRRATPLVLIDVLTMADVGARHFGGSSLVCIEHVAAMEGLILEFKSSFIEFTGAALILLGLSLFLCLIGGHTGAWKCVNV